MKLRGEAMQERPRWADNALTELKDITKVLDQAVLRVGRLGLALGEHGENMADAEFGHIFSDLIHAAEHCEDARRGLLTRTKGR